MAKVILTILALLMIVVVGIFISMDQEEEITTSPTPSVSKKEAAVERKEEVTQPQKISKPATKTAKSTPVMTRKPVSTPNTPIEEEGEEFHQIGKNITQEDIDNAASEEEKEILRGDMAYYQSIHSKPSTPLTKEETRKLVEEDVKNGLIK